MQICPHFHKIDLGLNDHLGWFPNYQPCTLNLVVGDRQAPDGSMCSCCCFEAQARSFLDPTYSFLDPACPRNMFHNVYAVLHAAVVVVDAGGDGGTEANAAHF